MANKKAIDIISTISEDEQVDNFSEDSDEEIEFQPKKHKKDADDFDSDFQFVGNAQEYQKDIWNDLNKYIKRKAKNKIELQIKKLQNENVNDTTNPIKQDSDASEYSISEDELKHDQIKVKERKKRRLKEIGDINVEENQLNSEEATSFYQMNLSRPLLKALAELKFVHPTPIQASAIPIALLGKDICGCAATGTGKTAAYMLPTLERLLYKPLGDGAVTRVLVLVPTRELGVQVYQVTKGLTQFTNIEVGLAVGGLDLKVQETILRKNPDIVIATPGRLIDHLKSTPTFNIGYVEVLILDEADRMLDEFFAEQMNEIIKQCSRQRQTMLFSATMTEEVENLASLSLTKPVRLFVDSNRDVAFNLRQEFIRIRKDKEADREPILAALLCRTFREKCLVFVQTKKHAHRLRILLGLLGLKVAELHGNLSQPQRLAALEEFKQGTVDILVATDVAARGLDIYGVKTVINFLMPATMEHYIHRVGRTARAGRAGVSVSLAGELERKIVKDIIKHAKSPVKARIISVDILEKYKKKLELIEPQINQILTEEHKDRLLSKMENQVNRVEKIIKGEKQEERPWFQTKNQRKEEKARLSLKNVTLDPDSVNKVARKHKKKKNETSDDHINYELNKVALVQAKLAKRKQKKQKLNVIKEDQNSNRKNTVNKKTKSHFLDIVDTSQRNAKKLRHQAKLTKKNIGGKSINNKNKKSKLPSKTYGKPLQKKRR